MAEPTVALISPGQMGASIGARLVAHGVRVMTPEGRSAASEARAKQAGLAIVREAELRHADFVFSVVPPADAVATARRVAAWPRGNASPLYVDWNAVSPATAADVCGIVTGAGVRFADGCIIGLPGTPEDAGPRLVASGPEATGLAPLFDRGLRLDIMDRPVGAASALKMSYAGLTKGLMALGAAMLLAAHRAGCDQALIAELASSQPSMLQGFTSSIPALFGKVERFVPEMREIADFVGEDRGESGIYEQIAGFYSHLTDDLKGARTDVDVLLAMFPKRA